MVNKYYDLATMQEKVPASLREHYHALSVTADACIGCRACEEVCPQNIRISEMMSDFAEKLK